MPHRAPPTGILVDPALRTFLLLAAAATWGYISLGVTLGDAGQNPAAFHTNWWTPLHAGVWLLPVPLALYTLTTHRGGRYVTGALFLAPGIRIVSYFSAWIEYQISGGTDGIQGGWYTAGLHLGFLIIPIALMFVLRSDTDQGSP